MSEIICTSSSARSNCEPADIVNWFFPGNTEWLTGAVGLYADGGKKPCLRNAWMSDLRKVLHYSGPKLHRSPWRLSLLRSQGSCRVVAPDGLLNASLSAPASLMNTGAPAASPAGHRCTASQGRTPPPPPQPLVPPAALFIYCSQALFTRRPASRPPSQCPHVNRGGGRNKSQVWPWRDSIFRRDRPVSSILSNFPRCLLGSPSGGGLLFRGR